MKKIYKSILSLCVLGVSVANAQVTLDHVGTFATGLFDEGAAEIVDYSASKEYMYFVNASAAEVQIVNIADPANPTAVSTIAVSTWGAGVNSVSVGSDFLAVAVENANKQANGAIVFFDLDGNYLSHVEAGALPDMVIITPDENYVLSANEGEPNDDYTVDPEGSITIVDISGGVANVTQNDVSTADFTAFNSNGNVVLGGIDPLQNNEPRVFGNNGQATFAEDMEPEYIAISDDSKTAYVACQENNAVAIVDIENATVTSVKSLGYKDHSQVGNGFDASNRSSSIKIKPQPTYGMYQPDAMVLKTINGTSYLFTANEGDARDYDGYSEEARVKDITLAADVFGNVDSLQNDTVLGRLNITTSQGDIDNDGEFEQLYSYGARSFGIWDASDASLVFDSRDMIEQRTAAIDPEHFNSTNDDNDSWKNRSDDKGPEPEAIDVGIIDGKYYAFVGLERVGGVMVFDVTLPTAPTYVDYLNIRNWDVAADDANAGDIAPECIRFISSDNHSSGKNMILVSNEVSGTVSIYEVKSPNSTNWLNEAAETMKVFPNPNNGDVLYVNEVNNYQVINMMGQVVVSAQNTQQIDISTLEQGTYFLVVPGAQQKAAFVVTK
jgi:hypothetical protein